MDGGEFDYREKGVVEEEQKPAGDEVIVDYSDYVHQMFDEMPVPVGQFSFVKVLPLGSPDVDAMIKKAEETIEKMNQDQVLLAQKIRKRIMDSDNVRAKLCMINYYDNCGISPDWDRERLNILHLSLDKLTFANSAYKEKSINSCLSGGEVDKQKLSFSMVHGRKNMADERNLLREIKASQGKDDGMTVEELCAPIKQIQRLEEQMCYNYQDRETAADDAARNKTILKDIKQHKIAREKAIADAFVNGKLWNSLGSQEAIRAELQELTAYNSGEVEHNHKKVNTKIMKLKKNLEKIEKDISSLQKRLKATNRKKDATYSIILNLKKQYEEEYHSLPKKVEVLAEKKDIAAIQELSQAQVEKVIQQWNNCRDFKSDYEQSRDLLIVDILLC